MSERSEPASSRRPAAERYVAGQVIGEKYTLLRRMAEGGMGTVWVAHDAVLDVDVALKIVALEGSKRSSLGLRMLEEARTAARLGHPAIVRVLDFGVSRHGDPFLTLELLDGEDLADILARERRVPAAEAVSILLPIAHALATAHDSGIVHRDVKPENIFIARTDVGVQPKLLDFGIARFLDRPARITLEGAVIGTPDYMSPQMARGEPVHAAGDQWGFCVVLYELVTGRCPFRADNYNALIHSIIKDEPPSVVALGAGDARLWALMGRALRKQEAQRYSSMREFGQGLARWLLDQGINEDVTGTSIRRTWFRDEDNSADLSSLRRLPVDPESRRSPASAPVGLAAGVSTQGAAAWVREVHPPSGSDRLAQQELPSQPELEALAELHRGDPERMFERASLLRTIGVGAVLVGIVLVLLVLLLFGAGILGPGAVD